jgi:hypothetical protein
MTVTYLLAYFFTPYALRFNVPILNVSLIKVVEYAWPGKFVLKKYYKYDYF